MNHTVLVGAVLEAPSVPCSIVAWTGPKIRTGLNKLIKFFGQDHGLDRNKSDNGPDNSRPAVRATIVIRAIDWTEKFGPRTGPK